MTEERRKLILDFEEKHRSLDDESFYRLAEMRGIKSEEFIEANEDHAKEAEKISA